MIGSGLSIQGLVHVQLEQEGKVVQECWAENRMVDGGLNFIIQRVVEREYPPGPANVERIGAAKYGDSAVATTAGMTDIQGTELTLLVGESIVAGLYGHRIYAGDGTDYDPGAVFGRVSWRHFLNTPPDHVLEVDLDIENLRSGVPLVLREIGLFLADWETGNEEPGAIKYSYDMTPTEMIARVVIPDFQIPAAINFTRLRSRWFFAVGNVPDNWTFDPRYPMSQDFTDIT